MGSTLDDQLHGLGQLLDLVREVNADPIAEGDAAPEAAR